MASVSIAGEKKKQNFIKTHKYHVHVENKINFTLQSFSMRQSLPLQTCEQTKCTQKFIAKFAYMQNRSVVVLIVKIYIRLAGNKKQNLQFVLSLNARAFTFRFPVAFEKCIAQI